MGLWRWMRFRSRRALDTDLEREIQGHLDLEMAENIERGADAGQARAQARRQFGNPVRVQEEVRELSAWRWLDRARQDIRYGLRTFGHSPAFTSTAVLTLALGIGANVAIFTLVDALLIKRLPVADPERLVVIRSPDAGDFEYREYRTLRDGSTRAAAIVGASNVARVSASSRGEINDAYATIVTPNYFEGLGVAPEAGRTMAARDPLEPIAVVSHQYWSTILGGRETAIGETLSLDGVPFTIVGVAPASFSGEAPGQAPDVWTSFALQAPSRVDAPGYSWLNLMARLKPGVAPAEAAAEFGALLTAARPTDAGGRSVARRVELQPGAKGWSMARQRFAAPLTVLAILVGLLFVITCTNLAGLLLARATTRTPEIALRMAIGGTAGRILRQMLTESLLLALPGGALGVLFGMWATRILISLVAIAADGLSIPAVPTARTIVFAAAASIVATLLFGLAPALRAIGPAARSLGFEDRRVVGRSRRWGLREGLVIVQVALTFLLVGGGVMFVRTLRNLQSQEIGYQRTDHVLLGAIRPNRGFRPASPSFATDLLDAIRAVPGVTAASFSLNGPVSSSGSGVNGLQVDGYTSTNPQDLRARADWVTPQFFAATGLPLVAGREFSGSDTRESQRVAVVNSTWVRHYFGGQSAVGRHFTFNRIDYEIVGVARDAKYTDLREPAPRIVYFALLQGGGAPASLQVRVTASDPASIAPSIRAAIRQLEPRVQVDLLPFADQFDRKLSRESLLADLSGFFGVLTLLLVSVAIYGTLAFSVARRSREIAVRLALGARRMSVLWTVARDVTIVLTIGVGVGIALAAVTSRLVASLLFGLQPGDVLTLATSAALLMLTALAAGTVPAVRAARLDPAAVLRE
jgi:predicted permease